MTKPDAPTEPSTGLYEELITLRFEQQLKELGSLGWHPVVDAVGPESVPHVLARHVAGTVRRVLQGLPSVERVHAANHILESISTLEGAQEWVDLVADGPRQLLALTRQEAPGVFAVRPGIPLSDTALITNSPEDPSLGFELRAELATADHVDLLCAFVKWHGLRIIEQSLQAAHTRGVPIRVITTTYIGATERRALDRLVREFNAQVKVNYETRSTRLHAKAWLFRRESGYDTAYVGSSNLSKAALLDGLEWNVRLSSIATPDVLRKFGATFEAYWNDLSFETYDPDADGERLHEALAVAGGTSSTAAKDRGITLSGLEVRPYPHQRDMLERLEVEREVHHVHRNLLVAATGTGKTVMAALDYRQLRKKYGRDVRLLFVAHRKEILQQSLRTYQDVLMDANFGESLHSGEIPERWNHVFASVQSLNARALDRLARDHFDVIVIDEFHHGTSPTYRKILDYFQPDELLGLTATPERMDGKNIQDEFFDGRIAAEMRLWEALENELLSPFHYFGITDTTDLSTVEWKRGAYDAGALSNVLTGNVARARLVVKAVRDKVSDPGTMRALGFCVSVAHAHFMAESFRTAGLNAVALSGSHPAKSAHRPWQTFGRGRCKSSSRSTSSTKGSTSLTWIPCSSCVLPPAPPSSFSNSAAAFAAPKTRPCSPCWTSLGSTARSSASRTSSGHSRTSPGSDSWTTSRMASRSCRPAARSSLRRRRRAPSSPTSRTRSASTSQHWRVRSPTTPSRSSAGTCTKAVAS